MLIFVAHMNTLFIVSVSVSFALASGEEEINRACKLLGERVDSLYEDGVDMPDIVILPVYAALPAAQQQQVFAQAPENWYSFSAPVSLCVSVIGCVCMCVCVCLYVDVLFGVLVCCNMSALVDCSWLMTLACATDTTMSTTTTTADVCARLCV
jgi:hypothetical protein